MENDPAAILAKAIGKASIEAPAGHGKTEVIASAVALCTGRQLILTHTHAGVASLKKRIQIKGVSKSQYRVETIDSFCMRYSSAYPITAAIDPGADTESIYVQAQKGAARVLRVSAVRRVVASLFEGVIVDEYQDCQKLQHEVCELLAEFLPVRVLGDRLQSLFTWRGQNPIDWAKDVEAGGYIPLARLDIPQRWMLPGASKHLGEWLTGVRHRLLRGQPVVLDCPTVRVIPVANGAIHTGVVGAVKGSKAKKDDSVVVLYGPTYRADRPHPLAALLSGFGFTVMMEIEGKALQGWCQKIDAASRHQLVQVLLDFADICCTKCTDDLRPLRAGLERQDLGGVRANKAAALLAWLVTIEGDFELRHAEEWLRRLSRHNGRRIHHRELFFSMCEAIRYYCAGKSGDLINAAIAVRSKQSHAGRRVDSRCIARTTLVKGLQFDHVIVVLPEMMNRENQYVAFSRAVKTLTIVTTTPDGVVVTDSTRSTKRGRSPDDQLDLFD